MFQSYGILQLISTYRYAFLFPLACFEGPLVAIIVGFFIHLGYLDILPSYLLLIAGDFFPDTIYYYIGRYSNKSKIIKKYISKSNFLSKNFDQIKTIWHTHTLKTMFFAKLAYGLSIPLLISSGNAKLPYKKFVFNVIIVSIFQYGIFLLIGYYFGRSSGLMAKYIKFAGIIIGFIGIIIIVAYIFIKKYAKKQIIKMENENNL